MSRHADRTKNHQLGRWPADGARLACDGEIFAAGHARQGNDVPLLHST
jgi:hypothetical protein